MGKQIAGQIKDACKQASKQATGSEDPGVFLDSYTDSYTDTEQACQQQAGTGAARLATAAAAAAAVEHRISGSTGSWVGPRPGAMGNQVIADRTIPDFLRKPSVCHIDCHLYLPSLQYSMITVH